LDSQGNLFVLDSKARCVKKFDSHGDLVTTFGRPGRGPGDLDTADQINVGPDDNVLIYDLALRRFSFFANDGEFISSVELNDLGSTSIGRVQLDSKGQIFADLKTHDFRDPQVPNKVCVSKLLLEPFEEVVINSASMFQDIRLRFDRSLAIVWAPGFPRLL
jgi:hypothetical protein